MGSITIKLNGESREVPDKLNLDRLLELFSLPKQRIAIELNNTVVPRSDWLQTAVRDTDKIEIVHFVGGG